MAPTEYQADLWLRLARSAPIGPDEFGYYSQLGRMIEDYLHTRQKPSILDDKYDFNTYSTALRDSVTLLTKVGKKGLYIEGRQRLERLLAQASGDAHRMWSHYGRDVPGSDIAAQLTDYLERD